MTKTADLVIREDRLALSRLITKIENGENGFQEVLDSLFAHTGNAHIIGVTGPPGVGKSTLVNRLAAALQNVDDEKGRKIGIIAVDPTSPFTGGALLGDRVRMRDLFNNDNIFIRSMASRGALGGIAQAADSVAMAMDAAGFQTIIIETVGAGQSEVEIASLAHTTIVVEAPGLGDDIQAAKAGILEIADILVVNKADKPNAEATAASLEGMLSLDDGAQPNSEAAHWQVPVMRVSALHDEGITDLAEKVEKHKITLLENGLWKKREMHRYEKRLNALLRETLFERWNSSIDQTVYTSLLQDIAEHRLSPHKAAQKLLG